MFNMFFSIILTLEILLIFLKAMSMCFKAFWYFKYFMHLIYFLELYDIIVIY